MKLYTFTLSTWGTIRDITIQVNTTLGRWINTTENADKAFTAIRTVIHGGGNAMMCAKGAKDVAVAIACQDGPCAIVSAIGCCLDVTNFVTTYIPAARSSQIVTIPLSAGCKTFVQLCKGEQLPWFTGCR